VTTGFYKAEDWALQPANRTPHYLLGGIGELFDSQKLAA